MLELRKPQTILRIIELWNQLLSTLPKSIFFLFLYYWAYPGYFIQWTLYNSNGFQCPVDIRVSIPGMLNSREREKKTFR